MNGSVLRDLIMNARIPMAGLLVSSALLLSACAGSSPICIDGTQDCIGTPSGTVANRSFATEVVQGFVECSLQGCHSADSNQGELNLDGSVLSCSDLYAELLTEDKTDGNYPPGPRIETGVAAAETFFILKSTNANGDHDGGERITAGEDEEYTIWTQWIDAGAQDDCQ